MYICDTDILHSLGPIFLVIYLSIGVLLIAIYVSFGIAIPLIMIYIYYVIKLKGLFFKPNGFFNKYVVRVETPVSSYFLETLQGLTVIRAYGKVA